MEWEAPIWESYAPKPKKRRRRKPPAEKLGDAAPSLSAAAAAAEVLEAVAVLDAVALPAEDVSPPRWRPSRAGAPLRPRPPRSASARARSRGAAAAARAAATTPSRGRSCSGCRRPRRRRGARAGSAASRARRGRHGGAVRGRLRRADPPGVRARDRGRRGGCGVVVRAVRGARRPARLRQGRRWLLLEGEAPPSPPLPSAAITPSHSLILTQPRSAGAHRAARRARAAGHRVGRGGGGAAGHDDGDRASGGAGERGPRESELRPGLRLVALFPNAFDGEPFACELIGTAAQGRVAVRFDDGLEHESTVRRSPAIRPSAPAPPTPDACLRAAARAAAAPRPASLRGGATAAARPGGAAAPPSRGASQQRAVVRSLVCQEAFRHGPLHRAMAAFEGRVARRRRPGRGVARGERRRRPRPPRLPRVSQRRGGAPPAHAARPPPPPQPRAAPLHSPSGVLPASAPRCAPGWALYNWGGVGAKEELASMLRSARRPAARRPAPRCIPHRSCARRARGGSISGRRR